jgi:hypothetical protein
MPPFSLANHYNPPTTRKPLICQFPKNTHLISALIAVSYKNVKICARIQWTFLNVRRTFKKMWAAQMTVAVLWLLNDVGG